MSDPTICPKCHSKKECIGGRSAHYSNWICVNPDCKLAVKIQAISQFEAEIVVLRQINVNYKSKIAELETRLAAKEFDEAPAGAEWREGHPIFNLAQENDTYRARIRELEQRIKELEQDVTLKQKGLGAVASLINESYGVSGLHLNGDIAPWSELQTGGRFEEWLHDFDAAINGDSHE